MNYKYNILWLDDEPIKALEQIREVNPSIYFDKVKINGNVFSVSIE